MKITAKDTQEIIKAIHKTAGASGKDVSNIVGYFRHEKDKDVHSIIALFDAVWSAGYTSAQEDEVERQSKEDVCPVCGDDGLDVLNHSFEDGEEEKSCRCEICGAKFTQYYKSVYDKSVMNTGEEVEK